MLLLDHDDVRASVTMHDAIAAMEDAFQEQGEGAVALPQRLNLDAGHGWLRLGPAVLRRSGWMGFKAMNLAPDRGHRYQVHLYRIEDGALVAIMDAQHLTTLRTGATSAVATRRLARPGPAAVGLFGSGVEARSQAEALHALGLVGSLCIYSRTPANRERLARELARDWGIEVVATDEPRAAAAGRGIVAVAVRSTEPVLLGEWLEPGAHVASVGAARPEHREIDANTFRRSAVVVVDTRQGVFEEAGDAIAARDVLPPERAHELADLVLGRAPGRTSADQITLFKSVGTGIQDVALAACIYQRAREMRLGTELPEFPRLRPL
jgi:ornithine cyclodeaminase/alanine dehydrogenase